MLGQVFSRAAREQGDRGKPGGQVTEQHDRSGQRSCLVRIIDNRRQCAVEVEAQGRRIDVGGHSGSVLSNHHLMSFCHGWPSIVRR
jgi:hypothetical protein